MLLGALADAGADQPAIASALAVILPEAQLSFERVTRRGVSALKFRVISNEAPQGRHLKKILDLIADAPIPERAKQNAATVFRRLGEVEAAVHQVPIERVHFHEVGGVDSIADIVGVCLAMELLSVDRLICSPLNVGSGTVETEHGTLPVPAPATAALIIGRPVYSRGPAAELTTPTGAAVAVTLAGEFGPMPPMTIEHIGYGAGDRDFAEQANVLRVVIGTTSGAKEATSVLVMESNIDDASPQVLAYAAERLLESGALDVTMQALEMKKGRPGVLLRVIARPEDRLRLSDLIFAETPTLGIRIHAAERLVQSRDWVEVETPHGRVRVKVAAGSFAPEYEDCRRIAIASGVPLKQIIAEASHAYLNSK